MRLHVVCLTERVCVCACVRHQNIAPKIAFKRILVLMDTKTNKVYLAVICISDVRRVHVCDMWRMMVQPRPPQMSITIECCVWHVIRFCHLQPCAYTHRTSVCHIKSLYTGKICRVCPHHDEKNKIVWEKMKKPNVNCIPSIYLFVYLLHFHSLLCRVDFLLLLAYTSAAAHHRQHTADRIRIQIL